MKFLSAPWRWDFISQIGKIKGCVFCEALKQPEDQSLICHRGKDFFVILNKYPYSTGHLMIVPYEHVNSPELIAPEKTVEMWSLMNQAMAIIRENFHPGGFNHIVPRWDGDANFMPIVGETRVLSYSMDTVLRMLRDGFKK
jgi:ATP adenylyltransferase